MVITVIVATTPRFLESLQLQLRLHQLFFLQFQISWRNCICDFDNSLKLVLWYHSQFMLLKMILKSLIVYHVAMLHVEFLFSYILDTVHKLGVFCLNVGWRMILRKTSFGKLFAKIWLYVWGVNLLFGTGVKQVGLECKIDCGVHQNYQVKVPIPLIFISSVNLL